MWKTINPHKELLVDYWIHPGRLELEHDGLVQMIFLFNWVMFRFQPVIFQYSVDTPSISNGFGNASKNTFCLSTFLGRSLGSSFTWTCGLHVETILAALGPINTSWWLDTTSRTDISPFRVVGRFIWYNSWSGKPCIQENTTQLLLPPLFYRSNKNHPQPQVWHSPENWWMEDYFPFGMACFQGLWNTSRGDYDCIRIIWIYHKCLNGILLLNVICIYSHLFLYTYTLANKYIYI